MLSLKRGNMKKKIIILFLAILVGAILAVPALALKEEKKMTTDSMYILQLGVFKNYGNAIEKMSQIDGAVIYKSKDTYYVLAGISKEEDKMSSIENYLQNEGVLYYKKQMNILYDEDAYNKYVLLLEKVTDAESLKKINEKLLKVVVQNES